MLESETEECVNATWENYYTASLAYEQQVRDTTRLMQSWEAI